MTIKNLSQFATANWEEYKTSITVASSSRSGAALVENESEVYNFDEICKSFFESSDRPSSTDGLNFEKNNIHLIEFKSGFKQKITKDTFNDSLGKCKIAGIICDDYWNLFWENQDRKIKELIESIRLKAIESYLFLEKKVFPICDDNENERQSKLILTVVVDEDGVDGIEDILAGLSEKEPQTNNSLNSIRQSLKRLTNKKDSLGNTYLYDEIEVLTVKDFENKLNLVT